MNYRSDGLRMWLWSALFGIIATSANLRADEPDLVGSLRLAVDEEGAMLLELSQETQQALSELIAKRIAEGTSVLAQEGLGDLDKETLRSRWVWESEKLGHQLLSMKQRERLNQLLMAQDGMATLQRPDVRKVLALTSNQLAEIDQLLAARQQALANSPALRKQITIGRYERKFQAILTPAQLAQWERMAGLESLDLAIQTNNDPQNTNAGDSDGESKDEDVAAEGNDQTDADDSKETPVEKADSGDEPEGVLQFTFERTPWREVIDWLSEEADLSLYVGSLPPGSLTYNDRLEYTPDQAIERINRFLLPKGYSLIRSGKMLSVIGLEDGRRDLLLDRLAEYADLTELDRRGDHEVVKCVFTIAKADPQQAFTEIRGLVTLSTPLLLAQSRQVVVIETASKLRMIRATLEALESPDEEAGPVRRFSLEFIKAEAVLKAVRPLVGIENENGNIGPEISLSASADGKQVFGTGSVAKLAILEGVVEMLDKSADAVSASDTPILIAHPVPNGNLQAVDDVLQTILSGEDVRVAQEPQTGRIMVLGTQAIHRRVEETIAKLEGEAPVFEMIQLENVETFVAMSLIREMLDIPYYSDEEDEDDKDHPRLDWDSPSKRIFVRGSRQQVDEIKTIIATLEEPAAAEAGSDTTRYLPIHGERAQRLLESGKRFWPGNDDVLIFPPAEEAPNDIIEKEINGAPLKPRQERTQPKTNSNRETSRSRIEPTRFVNAQDENGAGEQPYSEDAPIKAQVTPRGILLHSNDPELLKKFEEHLRTIAGPGALTDNRMAIFHLKHVRPEEAKSLLSDIRDGEPLPPYDSKAASSGSRPNYSFSGPSVIADTRLNRLIVQGTMDEIRKVEKHLALIDRDESIADVQFRGKPEIVTLRHIRASHAAAIIRETYSDQLTSSAATQAQQQQVIQQQQQQQQQLQKQLQAQQQQAQKQQQAEPQGEQKQDSAPSPRRGGDGSGGPQRPEKEGDPKQTEPPASTASKGQKTVTQEATMSVAVDEVNNSLIIRAPAPLFRDVSALIRLIDQQATQKTEVLSIKGINPEHVRRVIQDAIDRENGSKSSSPKATPAPKPPATPQPQPQQAAIQPLRTEFVLPSSGQNQVRVFGGSSDAYFK